MCREALGASICTTMSITMYASIRVYGFQTTFGEDPELIEE